MNRKEFDKIVMDLKFDDWASALRRLSRKNKKKFLESISEFFQDDFLDEKEKSKLLKTKLLLTRDQVEFDQKLEDVIISHDGSITLKIGIEGTKAPFTYKKVRFRKKDFMNFFYGLGINPVKIKNLSF